MNIGLRRALHQLQRAGLDLRMAEDTFHRRFEAARPHLTNYYTRALVGELEAEDDGGRRYRCRRLALLELATSGRVGDIGVMLTMEELVDGSSCCPPRSVCVLLRQPIVHLNLNAPCTRVRLPRPLPACEDERLTLLLNPETGRFE